MEIYLLVLSFIILPPVRVLAVNLRMFFLLLEKYEKSGVRVSSHSKIWVWILENSNW